MVHERRVETDSGGVGYLVDATVSVELDRRFTYAAPRPDQVPRYEEIRDRARVYGSYLTTVCPESRELSLALTHLEQAVMFANAAIARRE